MNGRTLPTSLYYPLTWLALAAVALAGGCARGPAAPEAELQSAPQRRVLDFRLGWFHTANGSETLGAIAALYERDGALVAMLNQGEPRTRPEQGRKIYIPPVDDREQVRALLTRIHAQPDKYIVPQIPWHPRLLEPSSIAGVGIKPSEPGIKRTVSDQLPVSRDPRRSVAGQQGSAEVKPGQGDALKQVVGTAPVRAPAAAAATARTSPAAAPSGPAVQTRVASSAPPRTVRGSSAGSSSSGGFQWPVQGEVVTKFKGGNREGNFKGIEIAAEEGSAVKAARGGKVLLADELLNYGNLVILDHGDGFVSVYGYNQELLVRKGQQVRDGQEIARVGRQYRWRDPQLFFQIRKAGSREPIDPLSVLN